jgi:hypothetical protein
MVMGNKLVGLVRFERTTCRLGGGRSILLSYSPLRNEKLKVQNEKSKSKM